MKVLNKLVVGAAALVLLTACGPSKISYDKFHEKAVEAAKIENGYTKAVVDGKAKIKQEGKTTEYTFDKVTVDGFTNGRMSAAEIGAKIAALAVAGKEVDAMALTFCASTAELVANSDKATYYSDLSVATEDDGNKFTLKYDKNGLPTSYKFSGDASGSLKISWSK